MAKTLAEVRLEAVRLALEFDSESAFGMKELLTVADQIVSYAIDGTPLEDPNPMEWIFMTGHGVPADAAADRVVRGDPGPVRSVD